MKRSISVCGNIGSGKTTVLRALSAAYNWDIVSFGSFVKSLISGPDPTREICQELGQQLFSTRGPRGLIENVLRFHEPKSETHLFDGVRHISVIKELRKMYPTNLVIFLTIDDRQRYERFKGANALNSITSFTDFLKMSAHSIERGIEEIATVADANIDASQDRDFVLAEVCKHLHSEGIT